MIILKKNKGKKYIVLIIWGILFVGIVLGCGIYLNDYYRADEQAIAAFAQADNVTWQMLEDNSIVCEPAEAKIGFIFYPGGKVEYTAYKPLMEACAEKGILCVVVEMPFHLAVLDIDAAEGIQEQFPSIQDWYIGGHSLGGSMAAAYAEDNLEKYEGLILLGSYSTADLSATSLNVLSIYGSEDRVLNSDKYNDNRENLPDDFKEIVLDGGCHAYFGMYGEQEGDGTPTISNKEQIDMTANAIADFIYQ